MFRIINVSTKTGMIDCTLRPPRFREGSHWYQWGGGVFHIQAEEEYSCS
jgi:hypothetical protein